MKRTLTSCIIKNLPEKIIMISGPRHCGKATLSKQLYSDFDYLNEDAVMTSSSKLNTYRKIGDSLAGRYFQFRLHPLDVKEVVMQLDKDPNAVFDTLMLIGGFPEPFFKDDEIYYKRWRSTHLDIILRQDLIDEYAVRDIQSIETLVHMLQECVGSTVSYAQLAKDLERDPKTIKRWLTMLENLYVIFKVTPYHKNIERSLLKEPKYYFYDNGRVVQENGARLENLVACALHKELNFITDTTGAEAKLHFLRTKDGKEIDFLIVIDKKPVLAIEVKWSDDDLSPAFKYFAEYLPDCRGIQLVKNLKRDKTFQNGFAIRDVVQWLVDVRVIL